jgi:hypothetical protein
MSERFAAYTQGISAGWLTRNEARVKENMQPIDGLDEPILALNMGPGDLEHMIPATTQPAPSTEPAPGVGGNGIGGKQQ